MPLNQKPQFGIPLNLSHPNLKDVRWELPFNRGAGLSPQPNMAPNRNGAVSAVMGANALWGWGGARFQDSPTSYVDLGADNSMNNEMTFRCKFYPFTVVDTLYALIGSNDSGGSEKRMGSVYIEDVAGLKLISYWRNDSSRTLTSNTEIVAGRWYDVTITVAGVTSNWTVTIYINGQQDSTVSSVTQNANTGGTPGNLRIGFAGAFTGGPFEGIIDDVTLATRPWKSAEVYSRFLNRWQVYADPFNGIPLLKKALGNVAPPSADVSARSILYTTGTRIMSGGTKSIRIGG